MSVFLVHGFKWARNEIRVHVVLQEVDDAAPNNLMSGESEEAMNENFRDLYPGPMAKLPPLRFIEPLNANNEKFKYPSEPYAFVVDAVVQSEDWIDVTDAMNKAHIPASQWDAMADLRDIIARGEKIGWFVVHNGDRELAKQERLRKEANGFQTSADETEAAEQAEAIESKYSKELGEKVAKMQLPNKSNGKEEVKDAPHQLCIWQMTDFKGTDLTANRQETWEIQEAFPRRFEMKPWKILIIVPRWPGTPLGWEGIVTVDGISYEYLGMGSTTLPKLPNLQPAVPLTVSYDSQYSNFTFAAGPVEVTASFLSSVLPTDLCRTSIPLSYLTTSARSTDNKDHSIQFYSDVNAAWSAFESNVTIQWDLYEGSNAVTGGGNATEGGPSSIYSWFVIRPHKLSKSLTVNRFVYLQKAYEFAEETEVALWGNFTYSSSPMSAQNFSFESGFSGDLRYRYVMQHSLQDAVDMDYRPFAMREPVFAYAHDFGSVSSASVRYTIGSVQQPIVRYLTGQGVVPLQPWWSKCYGDIYQMINFHFNDFNQTQILASQFENQLKTDVDAYYGANMAMVYSNSTPGIPPPYANSSQGYNGTDQFGEQYIFDPGNGYGFLDAQNFTGIAIPDVEEAQAYYSIVALSTRQIMGAYTFAIPPSSSGCSNTTSNATEPLMFQKEISSDGNVNTVDVMYPAMPFFLYANPALLRYNLEPLYQNQEGGFYPNEYSMHDLGSHYPNATGHVEGDDEYMPVEESGNMILMSYAYYKFTSDAAYLQAHYPKLQQYASYLIRFSLTPGLQLSTDDFAGQLVNQTNLAIKGIVGLAAMGEIASIANDEQSAANYSATAQSFYTQWEQFAIDPSGTHTLLSYQWRSSYSLLYNTYPSLLLNLSIIPDSLFEMQSAFYPSVSQVFGVPLDSRHSYTKSDESMWTAATCSPETRRLFVNGLGYWLNETSTDRAFSDLFETIDTGSYPASPGPIYFIARPVAGGHFSLLALDKSRKLG
ncbi:MAG: hypothetical protein LQ350_003989 [Teloschistes chrysophthalmus]|nr:MAG: hypothetical protein LQ350_003989 [Niorma chrysophthalma]